MQGVSFENLDKRINQRDASAFLALPLFELISAVGELAHPEIPQAVGF
jgi:hypothetical protein